MSIFFKQKSLNLSSSLSCIICDWIFSIAFFFIILLARCISIPFFPIPFTLQTFAIPLLCLLSGSRKRMMYSLLIFAAYRAYVDITSCLISGGYILGFFVMAYILTRPTMKKNLLAVMGNILFCAILELFIGTIWMMMFISPLEAIRCGFLFFIPAGLIKCVAIVSTYNLVKSFSSRAER